MAKYCESSAPCIAHIIPCHFCVCYSYEYPAFLSGLSEITDVPSGVLMNKHELAYSPEPVVRLKHANLKRYTASLTGGKVYNVHLY